MKKLNDLDLLMEASQTEEFADYLHRQLHEYSGDIDPEFMGFLTDYQKISEILTDHTIKCPSTTSSLIPHINKSWYIYDIGCGYGFQHVFFQQHQGYLGLGPGELPKSFSQNAQFVQGLIEESEEFLKKHINSLPSGVKAFGIANMSIGRQGRAMEVFDRLFLNKWVLY